MKLLVLNGRNASHDHIDVFAGLSFQAPRIIIKNKIATNGQPQAHENDWHGSYGKKDMGKWRTDQSAKLGCKGGCQERERHEGNRENTRRKLCHISFFLEQNFVLLLQIVDCVDVFLVNRVSQFTICKCKAIMNDKASTPPNDGCCVCYK